MSRMIGIDLGTSTSEVAYYAEGNSQLIKNDRGSSITPSIVGLDDEGKFIVGEAAGDRYLLYPEKTAIEVKRLMGSDETIFLNGKEYTPVQLSAKILSYLKRSAEEQLEEQVDRAVITVPAYFNNIQRQRTIEAGKLAGLKVERIVNEPTAAALSYGVEHMEEESHVLVYDFGGGTFDVTLLEMFNGVLEVKASNGDNELGGKDVDEELMEYMIQRCNELYQVNLRDDIYAMVKLKEEAVRCKIALSTQDSYEILLPLLSVQNGKNVSLQETITREQFEGLIEKLVRRTEKPIIQVLKDARFCAADIDTILLVGGTTRIPYVKKFVEEILGKQAQQLVDPDLAVVRGAAIQAAMLDGDIDTQTGIFMTDVAPYPLGLRVARAAELYIDDDYLDILIERNVTIPVTKKKIYQTMGDFQTSTDIEIYQGENSRATLNYFLGKFILSDIPPKKAGEEKVEVSFSYNLNGMLEVKAVVVSTGKNAKISIDVSDIKEETIDTTKWKNAPLAKKFRSIIRKAEKLIASGNMVDEDDQDDLETVVEELKLAVMRESEYDAAELEDEILDIIQEYEE